MTKPKRVRLKSESGENILLCEDFLVLYERKLNMSSRRSNVYKLRVTSWNGAPPVLEKRLFVYKAANDAWFPYRQMALNADDLKIVMENIDKVMAALQSKPKEKKDDTESSSGD